MIVVILAAEAAFWVLLLVGLVVRYPLRRTGLSIWLLRCIPLVDVILVAVVVIDVTSGAPPSRVHALAGVYLGVTVAFGHSTIVWADGWFGHRFAGRPRPSKPAKGSRAAVRALWREWFRVVLAATIACTMLLALIAAAGIPVPISAQDLAQSPYWATMAQVGVVTGIWFLAGPAFAGRGRDGPPST